MKTALLLRSITPSHIRGPLFVSLGMLLLLACAENPADSVSPAQVSDASSTSATTPSEPDPNATAYLITPDNSKVEFEGSKVTGSHTGGFNEFSGEIRLAGESPENASLSVTIQTASIWSDNGQLTGHLKSPDFFDVKQYPEAKFELGSVAATDSGYQLSGNLTLHGVTKSISFPAQIEVAEGRIKATSEFSIDRFDFGIEYPGKPDDLIRREVVIRLNIDAKAA